MKNWFLYFLIPVLIACSEEPSNRDFESLSNSQVTKIVSKLHAQNFSGLTLAKISGVQDIKIESVEKIQCISENNVSKIFVCDILIKYEIISSENSLSDLIGFSGKKSDLKKLKLLKINNGWEIL